jgi:hypothetical protein
MSGSVKSLDPKCRRKHGLKEQSAYNVICSSDETFGAAVLW